MSSWQCARSCIMSRAELFGKTSNHPGDSAPLQPRFGALWLLAFPKTKITFEREEISDCQWDSEKYNRVADGDWQHCVRSQGAYFEGDWGVIVLCTMFLVSCIFFTKCVYFSYRMAGNLLDRPHIPTVSLCSDMTVCLGPTAEDHTLWYGIRFSLMEQNFPLSTTLG